MRRLFERTRQFREAGIPPGAEDLLFAREILGDGPLWELFIAQEPRDIRHAAATARWLTERGAADRDLIMAALLHDVGKGRQRRRDRVAWVVAETIRAAGFVAASDSQFEMRRALARTAAHSTVGAGLLLRSGAPERVVNLTFRHHAAANGDAMLTALQAADAAS